MLTYNWLSILAITVVHLGFAALLGTLIQQVRVRHESVNGLFALFPATALFIASSLSMPLPPSSKGFIWLASIVVIALSGWSFRLAEKHIRWAWHYAGFAMSLILLWSVTQTQPIQSLSLGASAGVAAVLSLRRGFRAAKSNMV